MIPISKSETIKLKHEEIHNKGSKMSLNVDNAYRITEKIAFPRLVGSEGERKAINIVLDEFRNAGYNSISQDTIRTSLHNWIFIRYIFLVLGSGLIVLALSFYLTPLLTLGIIIVGFYFSYRALKVSTSTEIKLSKNERYNFTTKNIFVKLKSKNSKCKVVFMGHWDSKSQIIPPSTRSAIFLIFILGSFIIYLLYIILSILKIFINMNIPFMANILLDLCIIIASIGAINYFNKTGNSSYGAFDNAAAVGTIIELARYYKEYPHDNVDLLFLSTGSEELNLGGVIHFIKKYKYEFEKRNTFFINLDFVGGSGLVRLTSSYGIPRKSSSTKLNNLFLQSARELKIKIKNIYAPTGIWSDFMPIVHEGFEACWLGSEPGLKFVHTQKDTMNLISREGMENILLLCLDVVKKLDVEYE